MYDPSAYPMRDMMAFTGLTEPRHFKIWWTDPNNTDQLHSPGQNIGGNGIYIESYHPSISALSELTTFIMKPTGSATFAVGAWKFIEGVIGYGSLWPLTTGVDARHPIFLDGDTILYADVSSGRSIMRKIDVSVAGDNTISGSNDQVFYDPGEGFSASQYAIKSVYDYGSTAYYHVMELDPNLQ